MTVETTHYLHTHTHTHTHTALIREAAYPFEEIFELLLDTVSEVSHQLDNIHRIQVTPLHVEAVIAAHPKKTTTTFSSLICHPINHPVPYYSGHM